MRKHFLLLIALVLAVLPTAPVASAQDFSLSEDDAKTLTPEAATVYRDGMSRLDHVDYAEALKCFRKAAEIDTANAPIRFLIAKLATAEARKETGRGADELLGMAEGAYRQVMALQGQGASLADVQRAQKSLDAVQSSRSALAGRDARMENIGNIIIQQRAKELFIGDEKRRQKEAEKRAQEAALRAARAGGAQAQGGGEGGEQ
ncbi:hypothetical protein JW916_08050 [Candidatus Sumerlaeota bacterium]|nr:hypothetical protein [Candidatus Sumerlaeota bacterium]